MYLNYIRIQNENDTDIPKIVTVHHLPEIAKYLNISDDYFNYICNTENVYFYKVYKDNDLVGSIHIEKYDTTLSLDILVFPDFQRMGLGTRIIQDVLDDVFVLDFENIRVSIDETNIASLKLFENAGFVRTSKEDELINLIYERK